MHRMNELHTDKGKTPVCGSARMRMDNGSRKPDTLNRTGKRKCENCLAAGRHYINTIGNDSAAGKRDVIKETDNILMRTRKELFV